MKKKDTIEEFSTEVLNCITICFLNPSYRYCVFVSAEGNWKNETVLKRAVILIYINGKNKIIKFSN